MSVDFTYKEKPDSSDHTPYVILFCEGSNISVFAVTDKIPQVCESVE